MLPHAEWLEQAKRLHVGMRMRVRHRRESRANMIIENARDRYWCYCQACKEGGVLMKDHVLLGGPVERATSLERPTDLARVFGSDCEGVVGAFLASKGMMYPYLPDLWYSVRAKRMLLQDPAGGWHGRDLTGRSGRKWLNYDGARFVGVPAETTVLTEDLFSMYKVSFALRGTPIAVCCTLGAGVHEAAVLALMKCSRLVWAYDGDKAGDDGYVDALHKMRPFGVKQYRARPPEGRDPKDMDCAAIRALIKEVLE